MVSSAPEIRHDAGRSAQRTKSALAIATLLLTAGGCGGDGPTNPAPAVETPPLPQAGWHLGSPRIYLADLDGDGLTPLAFGRNPAWSPGGQQLAFVRDRGPYGREISLVDTDGTNANSLVEGDEPAWSPDGTQLLFASVDGISRTDLEGSGPVLLIGREALGGNWWDDDIGSPSWSPDGQHIAFQYRGVSVPNSKIYIADADGSGPRRLTDSEDGQYEVKPSWSPAGPAIAYIAIAYIDYGLIFENGSIVKVVNVDPDGDQSPIVLHSAENYETVIHPDSNLAWSPDGNTIAFTAGTESQAGIWVLDTGTGNVSRLFPGAFDPSWGPDGRIAFASWEYCANEWIVSIWVSGSGQTLSNFYHGPTRASSLRVGVGGKLTWVSRNQLSPFISHIVSTSHPPGGTSFDSGIMQPGDTFSFIPGVEGTWAYVDQYSGLTGTFTASAGTSLPGLNCSSTGDIK